MILVVVGHGKSGALVARSKRDRTSRDIRKDDGTDLRVPAYRLIPTPPPKSLSLRELEKREAMLESASEPI